MPQDKPKLVVFSNTNVNELMQVSVMKSFSTYSNMTTDSFFWSIIPANLRIIISDGTLRDTLEQLNETIYQTRELKMQAAKFYHLDILDTIINVSVSAEAYAIAKPIDTVSIQLYRGVSDTTIMLKVDVGRAEQQEEFYSIQVNSGISVSESFPSNFDTKFFLFSTKLNDESSQHQQVTITKERFNISSFQDSMSVVVSKISKEYFTFLDAFNKNQGTLVNNFMLYSTVPSNVINGLGLFSTNSYNVHLFDLKEH